MSVKQRVILAGAGHATIAALRILSKKRPDAELILVNHSRKAWYTGALPGLIRGDIPPEKAYIDLGHLARACGVRFIEAKYLGFEGSWLRLSDREPLDFDFLVISTGATPNGGVKPIDQFLNRLDRWAQIPNPDIGILGGGPAGVELALALRIRLGGKARISVLSPGPILESAPAPVRRIVLDHLRAAKIPIVPKFLVPMDEMLHAHTPAPTLRVRKTLQLLRHDNVFAAGDCALFPTELPRSGAIAVRQGRTLAANLRRALAGAKLCEFVPPRHTLAILSLNSTTATAWHGNLSWTGRLPMALKTKLDSAWLSVGRPSSMDD